MQRVGFCPIALISGCIITDTFVFGSVGEIHDPPGGPADFQDAGVGFSQFDQCRGLLLKSALGSTSSSSFSLANDLSSASLTARMIVDEFVSGTNFSVQVTIAWTGSGDSTHQVANSHIHLPGFNAKAHLDGNSRAAQASGSMCPMVRQNMPLAFRLTTLPNFSKPPPAKLRSSTSKKGRRFASAGENSLLMH